MKILMCMRIFKKILLMKRDLAYILCATGAQTRFFATVNSSAI